jgi:hypothetical protein
LVLHGPIGPSRPEPETKLTLEVDSQRRRRHSQCGIHLVTPRLQRNLGRERPCSRAARGTDREDQQHHLCHTIPSEERPQGRDPSHCSGLVSTASRKRRFPPC